MWQQQLLSYGFWPHAVAAVQTARPLRRKTPIPANPRTQACRRQAPSTEPARPPAPRRTRSSVPMAISANMWERGSPDVKSADLALRRRQPARPIPPLPPLRATRVV
ncbi:hypothetical protein TSA66_03650 [Noviherbaspirillum autotrophicum]|uniref:Uncharacterized protein n=1 Tax=Noviherbaspirillum autotrophicum TaxID=709839 RepID=A0A0C2BFT6_9BURK|nr:hypothetical protein TSA66_03650 [Noviherbaspirillum autotrophicum]